MPKINVVVEGQTEETFVRDVLNPYISTAIPTAYIAPIIVQTRRATSGEKSKGGITKYAQFRGDVVRALADSGACLVTSIIDLFQLPADFPGHGAVGSFTHRVKAIEDALSNDIGDGRFHPYLSTHEFEALLLANPEVLCTVVGASKKQRDKFVAEVALAGIPESVNGNLPPSYRITAQFPQYDKVRHGAIAANRIGLDRMIATCEHFARWLAHLQTILADSD